MTEGIMANDMPAVPVDSARSIGSAAGALLRAKPRRPAAPRPSHDPEAVRRAFETGEFPYATKLTEKEYLERVKPLQVELLKAQNWVKEAGERIVVLFEGRDA